MFVQPDKSQIDALTQQAYQQALYEVHAAVPFVLTIGVRNTMLAGLFQQHAVASAAFITAYNPFGELLSEELNRAAQSQLLSHLSKHGLITLPGIGKDPSGIWPGEPSCLALGISSADACELGSQFNQNAIVWVSHNAVPMLALLR